MALRAAERRDRLFVGGRWAQPATTGVLKVIGPASEEVVAEVPEAREADIDAAVVAARRAFDAGPWPWLSPAERAGYLVAIADALRPRVEELAHAMTLETGVAISSTRGKGPGSIAVLEYQAGLASEIDFTQAVTGVTGPSMILREPVGVVAAIVPWNSPIYLAVSKLAPALLAGCTVVVKPSPETPFASYILAEAIEAAGLPEGVVSIVAAGRDVGQYLVDHPGVDKVAFTGSTAAGRTIMGSCAATIKRVSLELGGKSAAILLEDVDLDAVMPWLVVGSMTNSGQTCAALTRLLVPESRHDEIVDALSARLGALVVGDPFDDATEIGPLITNRQRERVEGYLTLAREEGVSVALGGGRPAGLDRGWYVEPTILTNVNNRMRIAREEIFGPVVAVISYRDEDDAVAVANDSIYGLGGAVFTTDIERGYQLARRVRTGTIAVNGFAADYATPFGGFKQSGIGREGGTEAVHGYTEVKTITVPSGFVPNH